MQSSSCKTAMGVTKGSIVNNIVISMYVASWVLEISGGGGTL